MCSLPEVVFTIICLSIRLALIKGGYLIPLIPKLLEYSCRLGGRWTAFFFSPGRVQIQSIIPILMCKKRHVDREMKKTCENEG